ncbi:MAG: MFS transporter [Bacteroidia bacterium]
MQNVLTRRTRLAYASGMAGWSILVNIIGVLLPYFWIPPSNAGWNPMLMQITFFGAFNLLALITSGGRLLDAVYDPFIGQKSDQSNHARGRRIPFMMWSLIPAVGCCALVFSPPDADATTGNAWWLAITLGLFFIAATTYIIPCNALLPELAATAEERLNLATWQQAGFVVGIVASAASNNLADLLQYCSLATARIDALQLAIWILCVLGGLLMLVPVLLIDERKLTRSKPSHEPLLPSLRSALRNSNFRTYIIADFSYYMALYIITSGLLYFVTVLAGEDESMGVVLMGTMVAISLLYYVPLNKLSGKYGKKKLVVLAFIILGIASACVFLIGKVPLSGKVQLFIFVGMASFPLAALGILPPAILADIARRDADETGENREGLFFAVKYFAVKLGQTLGIAVFSMLTIFGKDPGNDWGLRLSGLVGAVLCVGAGLMFTRFREEKK